MTTDRRQQAYRTRVEAAELARSREHPAHLANGDEERWAHSNYAMSFTKGLKHDEDTGLVKDPSHFTAFRRAIDDGFIDPFTANVPRPTVTAKKDKLPRRNWEAPSAGVVYDLEGPDAQAVTMAPAPALGSVELAYEMAEVYELAILRDVPFSEFAGADDDDNKVTQSIKRLNALKINGHAFPLDGSDGCRPRTTHPVTKKLTPQTAFRGSSPGVEVGPYLSQFLLVGNVNREETSEIADGRIAYGAQFIDQRVLESIAGRDFMTTFADWLDVQDGFNPGPQPLGKGRCFITTPRDLANYVHFDQLYQAYLNACLILLEMGSPLDPAFNALSGVGNLQVGTESLPRHNAGFALYGGPHILTLVTEVATRALKAVRYQKFNNHIRLRPETLAGRIARRDKICGGYSDLGNALSELAGSMTRQPRETQPRTLDALTKAFKLKEGEFLPMAFPEGSPMHPAYGAGHATVAGACVTVLKAFFDTNAKLRRRPEKECKSTDPREVVRFGTVQSEDTPIEFLPPSKKGGSLEECKRDLKDGYLTVEGELNKLAANISIGRNMAGVHYFSDYYDSVRMGEKIAIGMLQEQALCYPTDNFVMSVPTFDGDVVRIGAR